MSCLSELKNVIQEKVFVRATATQHIIYMDSTSNAMHMPWLFDFRAITLQGKWLDCIAELFWEKYQNQLPFQVGGLEAAGIPLVAAIVMKSVQRGTPINGFFIRKSRKREGLLKQVEGALTDEPIILVDDLINTGGSFTKMLKVLEETRLPIKSIFAILRFRAKEIYASNANWPSCETLFSTEDFGIPLLEHVTPAQKDHLQELWKYKAPNPAFEYVVQKSAPVIDDVRVYFGSDAGTFFALHQKDGSVAWSFDVGSHPPGKGIFSTPALHKGMVYFGAYDGNVYALNAATGAVYWKYSEADWIGSSPALAPKLGLVFIGLEFGLFKKRGGCAAIDMKTGRRVWIDRTPSLTHGSPLYVEEESTVYIGSNDGVLYAHDAKTGERKWTYVTQGEIKTTPAYDAKRRLVITTSHDGNVYALSAQDGSVEWIFKTTGVFYSIPLVDNDVVYVSSLDKNIYALELDTGKVISQFETAGRIFASPALYENKIWIGSNDGRLYELERKSLHLISWHQFSERVVNKIDYNPSTKHFFIGTVANEMHCLKRFGGAKL